MQSSFRRRQNAELNGSGYLTGCAGWDWLPDCRLWTNSLQQNANNLAKMSGHTKHTVKQPPKWKNKNVGQLSVRDMDLDMDLDMDQDTDTRKTL